MDLSIVIVTRNRIKQLAQALKSCLEIENLTYQIIVIDQADDPKVADICKQYDTHYYRTESQSLSASRNFGISLCEGRWVLFLDDDALVSHQGVQFLSHKLRFFNNVVICANVKCLENKNENFIPRHKNINSSILSFGSIIKMLSCGLIVPRDIITHQNFDTCLGVGATFGSGEETDLLIRISQTNDIIFQKDWMVLHPRENQHAPYKKIIKKFYSYGRGTGAVIAKHLSIYKGSQLFYYFLGPIILSFFYIGTFRFKLSAKAIAMFFGRISGFYQYKNS